MFPVAIMASRAQVTLPSGDTIPSLLNSAKLSLPANTPLGTRVKVTDGFVVSEVSPFTDFDLYLGFWTSVGSSNGKPAYARPGSNYAIGTSGTIEYDGSRWSVDSGSVVAVAGNEDFPWQADWSGNGGVLTHPAVQELTAPSTAQGGVFVSGGAQDGIYTIRGTVNAKSFYDILGTGDADPDNGVVKWNGSQWSLLDVGGSPLYYSLSDVATPDLAGSDKFVMAVSGVAYSKRGTFNGKSYYNVIGESTSTSLSAIFWSSATWHITNAIGVDLDTSTSAVATPDLATFLLGTVVTNTAWLNASDDSPASITVSSVMQGELDAGVLVTGAGTATSNGPFSVSGSSVGGLAYSKIAHPQTTIALGDAGGAFILFDHLATVNTYETATGKKLPYGVSWLADLDGTPPAPTVSRDDIASEANWNNV